MSTAQRLPIACAVLLSVLASASGAAQPLVAVPSAPAPASMHCEGAALSAEDCARLLLPRIRAAAEQDYRVRMALHATPAEIEEVRAYDRAFETHDRRQRARKLDELNLRLAAPDLPPEERVRLERFRAVLTRLADYEADVEAGSEPRSEASTALIVFLVEQSKLEFALYQRYGGAVGLDMAGPYAHGARAELIREYLQSGRVRVLDTAVEAALVRLVAAPPVYLLHGHADFTPYWRRAIPSSYMPD